MVLVFIDLCLLTKFHFKWPTEFLYGTEKITLLIGYVRGNMSI